MSTYAVILFCILSALSSPTTAEEIGSGKEIIRRMDTIMRGETSGSLFLNPEIRYNILRDLDWIAGGQIFSGDEESEYGLFPDTYYTSLEWYF